MFESSDEENPTERLLSALAREQVDFVLLAYQVAAGAVKRPGGVDFIVETVAAFTTGNMERLVRAVAPYHPRTSDGVPLGSTPAELAGCKSFSMLTDLAWLDVSHAAGGVDFEEIRANSFARPTKEGSVRVADPSDVISLVLP
ncbi:MAG: hypothetical protein WBV82_30575 [Myxococcaceae bacterium]